MDAPLVGIEETVVLQNVKVYPVPFGEFITVEIPNDLDASKVQIELFDVSGKKLETVTQIRSSRELKIESLKELPKGVYVLHLSANNKTKSFKLIH
jgi:hypothetical protein